MKMWWMISLAILIPMMITWHFYCAKSFTRATSAIPWKLSTSETDSAKSYYYWPPSMRGYVSGLARSQRERIQIKKSWDANDLELFTKYRTAEIKALKGPEFFASDAENASQDADAYLTALRDTTKELDKRKY